MDVIGTIVSLLGLLGFAGFSIWLCVCSFQKSIIWGLAYIFVPFASVIYLFFDWNRASRPFIASVVSLLIAGAGVALSPILMKSVTAAYANPSLVH